MVYSINLDPITQTTLKMQLFGCVTNTPELKKKIMSGELKCCIIKPELIYDPLQIVVAANKALTSKKQTTKSIFTEILFNLSPSTNISQSLLKFGIDDKDQSLLVVILENNKGNSQDIFATVQGNVLNISELTNLSDIKAIRKVYKINDREYSNVNILDSIVSRIATKE